MDASHHSLQPRPSLSESVANSVPTFTISEPESPARFEFEDPEDEKDAMAGSENNGLTAKDKTEEKPPKEKKSVTLLMDNDDDEDEKMVHFTFTPSDGRAIQTIPKPENIKEAVKV